MRIYLKNIFLRLNIIATLILGCLCYSCDDQSLFGSLMQENLPALQINSVDVLEISRIKINFNYKIYQNPAISISNYSIINNSDETQDISILLAEYDDDYPNMIILSTTNLSNNQTYIVYVQNLFSDQAVISGQISAEFTVPKFADISKINLIEPIDGTPVSGTPLFTWSDRNGATSYTVEIASDQTFTDIVLNKRIGNNYYKLIDDYTKAGDEENHLIGLLELDAVTYYWRVKANYSNSEGQWSDTGIFNVLDKSSGDNYIYVWGNYEGVAYGNKTSPLKTIQSGIDYALARNISSVLVADATYQESIIISIPINLYGGYVCSNSSPENNWEVRDIEVNQTIILAPSRIAVSYYNLNDNYETQPVIDGFSIASGISQVTNGIFCSNSSPTISNNTVKGMVGINVAEGSNPRILNNKIIGIYSEEIQDVDNAYGIYNDAGTSPMEITDNEISTDFTGIDPQNINLYCLYNKDSDIEITGNTFISGISNYIYGIENEASSPLIAYNTFLGNDDDESIDNTYSRVINNLSDSNPVIRNNTFNGGIYREIIVISNSFSAPVIYNNDIFAGQAESNSTGISDSYSQSIIINNNINAGSSTDSDCTVRGITIYNDNASDPAAEPIIINNNIFSTATSNYMIGIVENGNRLYTNPNLIQNNNIYNFPLALYADAVVTDTGDCKAIWWSFYYNWNCYTDIADANNSALTNQRSADTVSGNLSLDPAFEDVNNLDYHYSNSGSSPCELTTGALTKTEYLTTDMEDISRTEPWSIGAYENDGDCSL